MSGEFVIFHYCMRSPAGQDMWGRFVYHEIVAPERLVFINSFSDEKGGVTPNPWMPTWPLEVLNVATFTEHGGKTTLEMRGTPHNASPAERAAFEAHMRSMEQGFGGTFEQLDRYLAAALLK